MDPRLKLLRTKDGRGRLVPRFYPPGRHPALSRERAHIRYLNSLLAVADGRAPAVEEHLTYLMEKHAAFEESETEAKYHGLKLLDERDGRRHGA